MAAILLAWAVGVPAATASSHLDYLQEWSDFNGDGFSDLAIGVPGDEVNGRDGAGSVSVLYGTANGLTATGNQLFVQGGNGLIGAPEAGDNFGASVSAGDFNNDGYGDLAVGVPGEDTLDDSQVRVDAGMVQLIMGSASGLSSNGQSARDSNYANSRMGHSVAALDCQGSPSLTSTDGKAELAVGAPGYNNDQGRVDIFVWSAGVLNYGQQKFGTQAGERYGWSLATGPLGGASAHDIAIGIPGKDVDGVSDAGQVTILLDLCSDDTPPTTHQNMAHSAVPGEPGLGDQFGYSLAILPGSQQVLVGVPFDDLRGPIGSGPIVDAGSIYRCGTTAVGCISWNEGASGWPGARQAGDQFGRAVYAGELGRGAGMDIVAGIPNQAVGGNSRAGAVAILYSDGTSQVLTQDTTNVANEAEPEENFGRALFVAQFGAGATWDLAVGIPDETISGVVDAGGVHVFYGKANGVSGTSDKLWHRGVTNVRGALGAGDQLGAALN